MIGVVKGFLVKNGIMSSAYGNALRESQQKTINNRDIDEGFIPLYIDHFVGFQCLRSLKDTRRTVFMTRGRAKNISTQCGNGVQDAIIF